MILLDKTRALAVKILHSIDFEGAYSNIALNKKLSTNEDVGKAFITEVVYGVERWRSKIDWIIRKNSKIRLKKIEPYILCVLRLGVYQIIYMDSVPDFAAVNECVSLSKRYGNARTSSFVNAVLRSVIRNKDEVDCADIEIKYAHPKWLIDRWIDSYGEDFTIELLETNNQIPPITLRVNTLKIDRDTLIERLDIDCRKSENTEYGVIVNKFSDIKNNQQFKEGLFQIQDEASMNAVEKLDVKEGEVVIDVCSAPGGKSTFIAELMNNNGRVLARDIHEHKLQLLRESADRLGITCIETEIFDALDLDENLIGKADKVIVDAPCTGYGIIRKKPDIKWKANEDDSGSLSKVQSKILENASKYVNTGGRLVYSTCTLSDIENRDVVKKFCDNNNCDFELVEEKTFFPNIDKTDGFYVVVFDRKKEETDE